MEEYKRPIQILNNSSNDLDIQLSKDMYREVEEENIHKLNIDILKPIHPEVWIANDNF